MNSLHQLVLVNCICIPHYLFERESSVKGPFIRLRAHHEDLYKYCITHGQVHTAIKIMAKMRKLGRYKMRMMVFAAISPLQVCS